MSAEPLARCRGAARTYGRGASATVALRPVDCEVAPRARIAIVGESGSGKSTLLHLLAGLDEPTGGEVSWPAIGARGDLRPGRVAVVFQGPALMPALSVLENVALPLVLGGEHAEDAEREAARALERLGLAELAAKLPEEISGGQSQRAAVARALAGRPRMILADEPTGQLDSVAARAVVDVLLAAADHAGAALLVCTHDRAVAERFPERWDIHSGSVAITTGAAWRA
jgi:putative ABC transport system ATP-binding protein/lipoprotein-releasing system ATP-binding protein